MIVRAVVGGGEGENFCPPPPRHGSRVGEEGEYGPNRQRRSCALWRSGEGRRAEGGGGGWAILSPGPPKSPPLSPLAVMNPPRGGGGGGGPGEGGVLVAQPGGEGRHG